MSPQEKHRLSTEERDQIADKLTESGATNQCSRCGNNAFTVMDTYVSLQTQSELKGIVIGGPTIPCAVVICEKCGDVSLHALGALELLPNNNSKKGKRKSEKTPSSKSKSAKK